MNFHSVSKYDLRLEIDIVNRINYLESLIVRSSESEDELNDLKQRLIQIQESKIKEKLGIGNFSITNF